MIIKQPNLSSEEIRNTDIVCFHARDGYVTVNREIISQHIPMAVKLLEDKSGLFYESIKGEIEVSFADMDQVQKALYYILEKPISMANTQEAEEIFTILSYLSI